MVVPDAANVPLSNAPPSLVAVWAAFPLFTHFTTVPALIVFVAGEKAKSIMLTVSTLAPDGGGLLLLPDVGPDLPPQAVPSAKSAGHSLTYTRIAGTSRMVWMCTRLCWDSVLRALACQTGRVNPPAGTRPAVARTPVPCGPPGGTPGRWRSGPRARPASPSGAPLRALAALRRATRAAGADRPWFAGRGSIPASLRRTAAGRAARSRPRRPTRINRSAGPLARPAAAPLRRTAASRCARWPRRSGRPPPPAPARSP